MSDPIRRLRRPTPELRQSVKDITRVMIVEKGLSEVKARVIAKAAQTSVGTVYNLFGHLDDLVREINGETYDDLHATVTNALTRSRSAGETARQQLLSLADAYLMWVESNHSLWSATLTFNRSRPQSPDWYTAKEVALLDVIADALTAFTQLSEDERQSHARALWASVHGIVTMAMGRSGLTHPPSEVKGQYGLIINAVADFLDD